jgi:pimeloyl-ACP methyl ester carboxylesterase
MRAYVDGVWLYFDVEGLGLVPDGMVMRERPVLLLLHGGPGFDHAGFKPAFSALSDTAQIIYVDHRGHGRSEGGDDRSRWNLAQWADDIRGLCDQLGIARPFVLGNSFGGFVVMEYMRRHPGHAAGVILSSTAPRMRLDRILDAFEQRGGLRLRAAAEKFWSHVTAEALAPYIEECMPFYSFNPLPPGTIAPRARSILRPEILEHFSGQGGEMWQMDFRASLAQAQSPALILAGRDDPITPWPMAQEIADSLPPGLGALHCFERCGHGTYRDWPDETFVLIRNFLTQGTL